MDVSTVTLRTNLRVWDPPSPNDPFPIVPNHNNNKKIELGKLHTRPWTPEERYRMRFFSTCTLPTSSRAYLRGGSTFPEC